MADAAIDIRKIGWNWYTYRVAHGSTIYIGQGGRGFVRHEVANILHPRDLKVLV